MDNSWWPFIGALFASALFVIGFLMYLDSLDGPSARLVAIVGDRAFIFYGHACIVFLGEYADIVMRDWNKIALANKNQIVFLSDDRSLEVFTGRERQAFDRCQSEQVKGWGATCVIRDHPLMRKIEEIEKRSKTDAPVWSNKTTYESSRHYDYSIMPF